MPTPKYNEEELLNLIFDEVNLAIKQRRVNPNLTTVLLASGARTASGEGASTDLSNTKELIVTLDVTAASGTTPTLDVKIQHSPDGVKWSDLGTAFAQKTGVAREVKVFTQYHRYVKAVYTIAGTSPSFTFSVEATAKE